MFSPTQLCLNGRREACIQLKTTKDRYVFNNTAVFKRKKESVYTAEDGRKKACKAKNYQRQMCLNGRKKACIKLKTTKKESVYTAKNYQRQICLNERKKACIQLKTTKDRCV